MRAIVVVAIIQAVAVCNACHLLYSTCSKVSTNPPQYTLTGCILNVETGNAQLFPGLTIESAVQSGVASGWDHVSSLGVPVALLQDNDPNNITSIRLYTMDFATGQLTVAPSPLPIQPATGSTVQVPPAWDIVFAQQSANRQQTRLYRTVVSTGATQLVATLPNPVPSPLPPGFLTLAGDELYFTTPCVPGNPIQSVYTFSLPNVTQVVRSDFNLTDLNLACLVAPGYWNGNTYAIAVSPTINDVIPEQVLVQLSHTSSVGGIGRILTTTPATLMMPDQTAPFIYSTPNHLLRYMGIGPVDQGSKPTLASVNLDTGAYLAPMIISIDDGAYTVDHFGGLDG